MLGSSLCQFCGNKLYVILAEPFIFLTIEVFLMDLKIFSIITFNIYNKE